MILIGMWDSPFVRRVVVSNKLMGVACEYQQVSVFRHMDRFGKVNPVIRAPSLVCDDGTVLMDSTLILDYIESLVPPGRRLMPTAAGPRLEALHLLGIALAATEKSVQIYYEKTLRPEEKRHAPWLDRVTTQANAAFGELAAMAKAASPWHGGEKLDAVDVLVACAWRFSQFTVPDEVPAARHPALVAYSARAEALPEFASTPLD